MALTILPQREPFARVPGLAEIVRGPAFWRLRAALEKYCRGRALGRSFVISGNRGAGKTTMVLAAIEDLRRQSEIERGEPRLDGEDRVEATDTPLRRPLLVPLSGPDIMRERVRPRPNAVESSAAQTRPPGEGSSANGETASTKTSAADPALAEPQPSRLDGTAGGGAVSRETELTSRLEDSDNLLRQIARALHLAVAREFAQRYEETLPQDPAAEWLEAGAQLALELGGGAKVQALRRFWDLSGRFGTGVLFKPSDSPSPVDRSVKRDRQGLYELVALDVLADTYRIAIGKVEEDSSQTQTDSRGEQKVSWADELKTMAAPFAGLLGGAATGFGVFRSMDPSSSMRALSSVGAALVSAIVLTLSISPKRTSTAQSTSRFSRDNGVGSLAWRLGGVVDLLFQAGIAPVFVIDELDKVTLKHDLGAWIGDRAQELKSLLTERTFFCFLTGRGFAEKLDRERTERTYPPSYTQFSNYLFVNYLPIDLHGYLRRILSQRPETDPTIQQHEDMQAAILPHVILFRAEMHPIDIQRELNSLVVKNDEIQLYPSGEAVPRVDSFALLFQIAVEAVLSDENIARRMRDDPRFALLAVDAVYYAPRMWRRGEDLDISADAISDYLTRRRTPDDEPNMGVGDAASDDTSEQVVTHGE